MRIIINQCTDTLLYFPLYLAIYLCKKDIEDDELRRLEFELKNCNGDYRAVEALKKDSHNPDSIAIAVCDPIVVLKENLEDPENPKFQIIANLIERIGLWGISYIKKREKGGKTAKLHAFFRASEEDIIPDINYFKNLKISFCKDGFTTSNLLNHYFKIKDGKRTIIKDFDPDKKFGIGEFISLPQQYDIDVAFTNIPWVAKSLLKCPEHMGKFAKGSIKILYYFDPIHFPFTCISALKNTTDAFPPKSNTILQKFISKVYLACRLIYYFPEYVSWMIYNNRHIFNHLGLKDLGKDAPLEETVRSSIINMIHYKMIPINLMNELKLWEFALHITFPEYDITDESTQMKHNRCLRLTCKNDYIDGAIRHTKKSLYKYLYEFKIEHKKHFDYDKL